MDFESAGAIRDAFLFDVLRQFEGLSRRVPAPLTAAVWEDGREAVLAVSDAAEEWIRFAPSAQSFDYVLANPPFGKKSSMSSRTRRAKRKPTILL